MDRKKIVILKNLLEMRFAKTVVRIGAMFSLLETVVYRSKKLFLRAREWSTSRKIFDSRPMFVVMFFWVNRIERGMKRGWNKVEIGPREIVRRWVRRGTLRTEIFMFSITGRGLNLRKLTTKWGKLP